MAGNRDYLLQTLVWMEKQAIKPVLLHPRSKAAISPDYTQANYTPPSHDRWKLNDFNLGMVTGPRQNGPIDIDLDCDEAIRLAPFFLPPTRAVFGRVGKPNSHYLYRVTSSSFDKQAFLDPIDNTTIVEMRGDNGHQTVAPGSVHQDTGELIKWVDLAFPEITVVPPEDLTRAVRRLALAVLVTRHIWTPGYHNEPCKHLSGLFYSLKWTQDEAISFIQSLMTFTGDDDNSRIPTVKATYRRGEAGKKVSGSGFLRKQLQNDVLVDRILEWAGSFSINLINEYNERFSVIMLGNHFRVARLSNNPGEAIRFLSKDDFINSMSYDLTEPDEEGKRHMKARIWLSSPQRRQYDDAEFFPGGEETVVLTVLGEQVKILNLWRGWAVPPNPAGTCDAWLELLREVICGGDKKLNKWMLHWLANILRDPQDKSRTAPVIIGPEGAGKSLMIGYFGLILGKSYVTITNEEHVHGRFNDHLAAVILMHSEEALYGGDKKHAGIIRSLITDELRMHEPKGINTRQIRNFLRLILTSNESHAAPAKPGDRRYTVVDMQDRKASPALIRRVVHELKNDGPAALHHFLINMSYDPDMARTNVKNDDLVRMKQQNQTPLENWWQDTLMDGFILPNYLKWCSNPEDEDWPAEVSTVALLASAKIHAASNARNFSVTSSKLTREIAKFTGRKENSFYKSRGVYTNPRLDGDMSIPAQARNMNERQSCVKDFPDLNYCREAFERYLGQQIDWPEEEDTIRKVKLKQPGDNF